MRPLTLVARATRRRDTAVSEWRQAILDAREAGHSLREIAEAAGISHVRIHKILRGE